MVLRTNIFTNSLKSNPKASPLKTLATPAQVRTTPKPVVNKALIDFSKQTISAPKPVQNVGQITKQERFDKTEKTKKAVLSPLLKAYRTLTGKKTDVVKEQPFVSEKITLSQAPAKVAVRKKQEAETLGMGSPIGRLVFGDNTTAFERRNEILSTANARAKGQGKRITGTEPKQVLAKYLTPTEQAELDAMQITLAGSIDASGGLSRVTKSDDLLSRATKLFGEKRTVDMIPPARGGQPMQRVGREGIEVPATPPKKLDPIIEEAKKYKTADEFFLYMDDSIRDALAIKDIKSQEAIKNYWAANAKNTTEEVLDNLNPTGGLYVDYTPSKRANIKLGNNITTLSETLKSAPEEIITIYRGAPKSQKGIVAGDFVTTNYDLAKSYAGEGKVLSKKVKLGDVLDDRTEPLGEEYIYRPNAFKEITQSKQVAQPTPKTKSMGTVGGEKNVAFLRGGDEFNLPQTRQESPQIEPPKQAGATQSPLQDTPLVPKQESVQTALPKVLDDNTYVRNRAVKAKSQGAINKTINSAKEILKSAGKGTGKILAPISTRLENINPILKSALRKYEFNLGTKGKAYKAKAEPFVKKVSKFNKDNYADLDLALKNGDQAKIDELATKYNMTEELTKVRSVLDDLYKQAREAGYDLGYQKNYFPRTIKDVDGFLDYFSKGDDWSIIQQAIKNKEASLQRYLTAEEKANLINTLVRGYGTGNITLSPTGAMKGRIIDVVDDELNQFYDDSISALGKYLDSTNEAIEARKFFGKSVDGTNIEDSIGAYTLKLIEEGKIKPSQEKELRDILQARFNQTGARGLTKLYKDLSYIDTMGSTISAITQLGDIGTSLYKNGFYDTLKGLGKAVTKKQNITLKDIGIEKIAQEFEDPSLLSKALDNIFTLTGMNKIDTVMKETFVNGALERLKKEALNNSPALQVKLTNTFGDEADEVLQALKKGEVNENVKLLAFNELLDIQPVALSEMPEQYLKGGNGRIFYMLKTYTVKQFDIYRREIFREMKTNPVQGIKNLVKLAGALVVANATADEVKDFILGRETDLRDRTVDNLLRLLGISKFTVYKAREEGVGSAVAKTILPPFKFVDSLYKDILSGDNLLEGETVRSIPLIGNFYYWWFGKGVEKNEKRKLEYLREQREREIKPIYDSIQELKEVDYEQARNVYNNLDDRQKELYKKYRTSQKQKQTQEGKEAIKPIYKEIQKIKETDYDKAKEMYLKLSDDEKKYYKLLKEADDREKKLSEGDLATYKDGETDTESNLIDTVKTYAKAIGVDPITAFNRIFTGERIRYVAGDVIVIERLPVEESQAIKEERGGLVDELKLDHTIPLQLGGSNSKKNLKLVPTNVWESYSPVENALGKAVRNGKIKKKEAQQLITDFKNGLLTAEQVLNSI